MLLIATVAATAAIFSSTCCKAKKIKTAQVKPGPKPELDAGQKDSSSSVSSLTAEKPTHPSRTDSNLVDPTQEDNLSKESKSESKERDTGGKKSDMKKSAEHHKSGKAAEKQKTTGDPYRKIDRTQEVSCEDSKKSQKANSSKKSKKGGNTKNVMRNVEEIEASKKRKIESGFYQTRSDEDNTLDKIQSMQTEESKGEDSPEK